MEPTSRKEDQVYLGNTSHEYGTFHSQGPHQEKDDLKSLPSEEEYQDIGVTSSVYDEVLASLGEFGLWQQYLSLLLWLPCIISGAVFLLGNFTMLESSYLCLPPGCSHSQLPPNSSHPCSYHLPLYISPNNISFLPPSPSYPPPPFSSCPENFSPTEETGCSSTSHYYWEDMDMETTGVMDWGLVCGEQYKVGLSSSLYFLGLMVGSLVSGRWADCWGRKPTLLAMIIVTTVSCIAGSFCPEYWSYSVSRIFLGLGAQGLFILGFSLSVELIGSREGVPCMPWVSYKVLVSMLIHLPFALGEALLTLVAWSVPRWRQLQLVLGITTATLILPWLWTPESPRWLFAQGKMAEGTALVRKAARINKRLVTADTMREEGKGENESVGLADMFTGKQMIHTFLLLSLWPITALAYYGIALSMSAIGPNAFLSNALGALVEIPSYMVLVPLLDPWGRRPLFTLSLLFTSFSCFGAAASSSSSAIQTTFALMGKFFSSACFSLVYIITAELFPTTVRTTGIGLCSLFARLGGIIAPQLALLLPSLTAPWVPLVTFGVFSLLGSILAVQLPETAGHRLPDTFKQIESWGPGRPFWSWNLHSSD